MSALKSVLLAIELATIRRDEAALALVQVRRSYDIALDQMAQLESYAVDTDSNWSVPAHDFAAPEILHHYYQFMGRLQQAIDLQRNAVADRHQEMVAARKLLLDAEFRISCLNRLLEKKRSGIARVQAGREQRLLDEFATVQHRVRRTSLDILETP